MFQKERRTRSECVPLWFPPSGRKRNLAKVWNCALRAIRKHQGSFGEIHLTVRYATLRRKLIIVVDACRFAKAPSQILCSALVGVFMAPGCVPQEPVPLQ